ncbi:MAG: hypothetical protein A2073_04080 [Deltaproteobacteria bacterium GWC2_42_11]|nr:MAG: hypothetical protein A2073_04080 [Deltaproteobacteria bacterium GWC2_42_11]HBO84078.1 hypothetical protein [Deltaproteobacteria bacterium]
MNIKLLNTIIDEIKQEIGGGIVSNVHQMDDRHIILKIFSKGRERRLLISAHPQFFRIHLTDRKYENPPAPLRFCAYLRSHLINKRIEGMSVLSGERVVHMVFKDSELIAELTGRDSNIILIDKTGVILDAMRYFPPEAEYPRPVKPGLIYIPLLPFERAHAGMEIPVENFSSYNSAADAYYAALSENDKFVKEKAGLLRIVSEAGKKLKRKLDNLLADMHKAETDLKLCLHGELLLANFPKIMKGMKEITVQDYYKEPPQDITLNLNPALTPQGNVDRIFKKVRKARTAAGLLKERIPGIEDEIRYVEDISFQIDAAEGIDELSAVKEALVSAGYMKPKSDSPVIVRLKKNEAKRVEPIRRFKSTEGCDILCGRTAVGNDMILRRYASDYDIWFHAHGAAGSHVLLRLDSRQKEPSQDSILEAGIIAAFFSKARGNAKVEVAWTTASNVKKPKGAKPGLVRITNYKTIVVVPDEAVVNNLMVKDDNR